MLATRVITALILGGAVTAVIFLLPPLVAGGLLGALWLSGAWEWAGFARWPTVGRTAYVALFALLMLSARYWVFDEDAVDAVLAIAALWWAVALLSVLAYPRPIPVFAVAVAGVLVLFPGWSMLVYLLGGTPDGPALAFSILAVVWAADVGAYFSGRWLGRVKLAPQVSPGKTWEGVIGGMGLAALTGWLASLALGLPAGIFVIVALAAALASVVGDLTVSMFKRNVGLKDSGRLLPGHGGVLDRIDSLTAGLPVFTLGLKISGLVT